MGMMPGSTICGLADGAAWPMKNAIKKFRGEFEDYIKRTNPHGWMVTDPEGVNYIHRNPDLFSSVGVMDGGELRVAADGQVEYRGPNLMQGYWGKPDETAATIVDGWLQTGDVGDMIDVANSLKDNA